MAQQDTTVVLPSSPADIAKIRDAIHETAIAMQKVEDLRAQIKDIYTMIKEDFAIAPKYSAKMAKAYFKGSFKDMQAESSEFELLFETVLGDGE